MPSPRAKQAMSERWRIQRAIAAAKAGGGGRRLTRAEEEAAIERHLAERGVTRVEPVGDGREPVPEVPSRPAVMAGWRG